MDKLLKLRNKEHKNKTSLIKRFIAYLIDWYVGSALSSIPLTMLYMSLYNTKQAVPQVLTIFEGSYQIIAGLLSLGVSLIYYLVIPMCIYKGQTLGKKLLGLKMVNDDYSDINFGQLLLRQVVMIILVEGSLYTTSNILHQLLTLLTSFDFVSLYGYVGIVMLVVSSLCVIVFPSKKALHDRVAHTLVVDVKSSDYDFYVKKSQKQNGKRLKLS